jgi:hypothetical protein
VSFDQPFVVVAPGELEHRLAQVLDVFLEARPQALLLERPDEAFRAAVAGWFAGERGRVPDPKPRDRPLEVARGVSRSPIVAERDAAGEVGVDATEAVSDGS